jgi:hypothetical protein
MHAGGRIRTLVHAVDAADHLTPRARAKAQARIRRLTRTAIVVAGGATAFMGVTVAREHPGGSAPSSLPPSPAPAPTPAPASTTTTAPLPTAPAPAGAPVSPSTTPPTTPATVPPTTTTTRPAVTSGGTSRGRP